MNSNNEQIEKSKEIYQELTSKSEDRLIGMLADPNIFQITLTDVNLISERVEPAALRGVLRKVEFPKTSSEKRREQGSDQPAGHCKPFIE